MPDYTDSILKRIRRAKEQHLTELDLSNTWTTPESRKLTELPCELFDIPQLRRLSLRFHRLSFLPKEICRLENLDSLDIGCNYFQNIPEALMHLNNLANLGLEGNRLISLDERLKEMQSLTSLNIAGNPIYTLPHWIGQMGGLSSLNIANIGLLFLPDFLAKMYSLTSIDVSNNSLSLLPKWLSEMKQLIALNISENQFTELPAWLEQLQCLLSLSISGSGIRHIPDWVRRIPNLLSLTVSKNHLETLPEWLSELTNLQSLDVAHNSIKILPQWMIQKNHLESLNIAANGIYILPAWIGELKNLHALDIADNYLNDLPETICKLHSLEVLNLSQNNLYKAEDYTWLGRLKNLTSLNISGTGLNSTPPWLGHFQNLRYLNLSWNGIKEIGNSIYKLKSLEYLDLRFNRISSITSSIAKLDQLFHLDLYSNPINIPPAEVVSRGLESIISYYRQTKKYGEDRLHEAKLIIVGEPGAGKTSLAHKIVNEKYKLKPDESTTRGIDVIRWDFLLTKKKNFRVNIWDFGGHDIYHTLHQFFLTRRSLYILVADARMDNTDFFYWLNSVELLSDRSPLLIVINKKQGRRRDINEPQLREQFRSFEGVLQTDLLTNIGLKKILQAVIHHIQRLPHINAPLPKTWIKVREELEKDIRNSIEFSEYLSLCEQHGFTKEADKLQLIGYLHDIGVCLHFKEDPLLRKIIILKPEWGTEAVYKVFDSDKVINNLGIFTESDLKEIWWEDRFAEMREELLQLMIKFRLCYRLPNREGTYLAPQFLSEKKPYYNWETHNNLRLYYQYNFMPKGILTRLIVACHSLIKSQDLVWKTGVILWKDEYSSRAEVIQYYDQRRIEVRVSGGKFKRELMAVIMQKMDEVHSSFPRIKFDIKIPCECQKCINDLEPHFFSLEFVRRAVNENAKLQCQKSFTLVPPEVLVDVTILTDQQNISYPKMTPPIPVFISYAHKDNDGRDGSVKWLERVLEHLSPFIMEEKISVWSDKKIEAGQDWESEIKKALAEAKVAIILLSSAYLASNFIRNSELPVLLKNAEERGLKILFVLLNPSAFENAEFKYPNPKKGPKTLKISSFQAINSPSKCLSGLDKHNQDLILSKLATRVYQIVQQERSEDYH